MDEVVIDYRSLSASSGAPDLPRRADRVLFPDPAMPIVGPQDVVTVVGEYTNHYRQSEGAWNICKSELAINWSHGNIALFTAATERVLAQCGEGGVKARPTFQTHFRYPLKMCTTILGVTNARLSHHYSGSAPFAGNFCYLGRKL